MKFLHLPTLLFLLPIAFTHSSEINSLLYEFNTQPVSFENHQVWKVALTSKSDYDFLEGLQEDGIIDIWKSTPLISEFRVSPKVKKLVKKKLSKRKLKFKILIPDVQEMIYAESIPSQSSVKGLNQIVFTTTSAKDSFFKSYHNYEEIDEFYQDLSVQYPSLVTFFSIGKTYEGRDIKGIHIKAPSKTNSTKKQVVFHGGIHAREWIGPAVVTYIADALIRGYGKDERLTHLIDTFDVSIIPVLNIDGFIYTHEKNRMWRKNRQPNSFFCVGTDPNRNWGYKFGKGGASTNPCSEAYQGPKAFSAPESANMARYLKSNADSIITYIDFHAYSQLWMYPFGAECNVYPADKEKMDKVAKAAVKSLKSVHGTSFAEGPICEIIYQASGSSVDWAYASANITYPFAVELRDTGKNGFLLPPSEIIPSGEETLEALVSLLATVQKLEGL